MIDNSQDKGYISVTVRRTENGLELCKSSFSDNPDEFSVFIDYEDGNILMNDGNDTTVIGHYETVPGPHGCKVIDHDTNDLIGYVSGDLIYFCHPSKNPLYAKDPFFECLDKAWLATITDAGRITARDFFTGWGLINGSAIGGAAAFVAFFFNYKVDCIFKDYFKMEHNAFMEKHASYF